MLSLLENDFPHIVKRLHECWGDPESFDLMFADLMLDQRGGRAGWPFDAWQDLVFLQEIHDLAYGVAKSRVLNAASGGARQEQDDRPADYNWIYGE